MTFNVTSAGTYITNLQKLHWKLLQFSKGPGCHLIIIKKKAVTFNYEKTKVHFWLPYGQTAAGHEV